MTFQQLMSELGVEFREHGSHHHTTAGWVNIDCPWCSPGWQHYRLGYNISGGYCACWTCGPKNLTSVVMEITGSPFRKVKELLGDLERTRVPEEFQAKGTLVLPNGLGPLKAPHVKYLKGRKYDHRKLVKLWGIQGLGRDSELPWRVFIPIIYRGETVSWTTRAISDDVHKRYHSAKPEQEKIRHKELLYGEDYAKNAVIIVEGPTDVWRIGPGAVCTFGLNWTDHQVIRMARFPVRAVCSDNEPRAQLRAKELASRLSVLPGETYRVTLETGDDPGKADEEEIEELRSKILG